MSVCLNLINRLPHERTLNARPSFSTFKKAGLMGLLLCPQTILDRICGAIAKESEGAQSHQEIDFIPKQEFAPLMTRVKILTKNNAEWKPVVHRTSVGV